MFSMGNRFGTANFDGILTADKMSHVSIHLGFLAVVEALSQSNPHVLGSFLRTNAWPALIARWSSNDHRLAQIQDIWKKNNKKTTLIKYWGAHKQEQRVLTL
jgi:hypothetical protein